jgi:hypothetical protein
MEYSIGNRKIGKDTLIFNMGSATHCASKKAGLCDIDCYAMKAERMYKATLPYRSRQEKYWLENDAFTIAEEIQKAFNRKLKVALKYVRVNESGDFHSAECVQKLIEIAEMLPNVKFYTYTHRSDLITDNMYVPANLVINTSNFSREGFNQFKAIPEIKVHKMADISKVKKEILNFSDLACVGDCSICGYCKKSHGKVIGVPLH